MTFIDKPLKRADKERKKATAEALAQFNLPDWKNFSDESRVLFVTGEGGQLHVGDLFRISPLFDYMKRKGYRLVAATSSGVDKATGQWADVLTLIDAQQDVDALIHDLGRQNLEAHVTWHHLLRKWQKKLDAVFDHEAIPILRSPLLTPEAGLTLALRKSYSDQFQKRVIGVVWRTSLIGRNPHRNASLEDFNGVLRMDPEQWRMVSLQYGDMGHVSDEIASYRDSHGVNILFDPDINPLKQYPEALAQMAACDYVVSIDCSQPLQAAAMGVPTMLILSRAASNRWPATGRGCPFFPDTQAVFRQRRTDDWGPPVKAARKHIQAYSALQGAWSHAAARSVILNATPSPAPAPIYQQLRVA